MAKASTLTAEVVNLCGVGKRRYAVTTLSEGEEGRIPKGDTITFSLQVWTGERDPKRGQRVRLSGIEEFKKGWRASKAEPIQL